MASKVKKLPEKKDGSFKAEMMDRLKTQPFIYIGTFIILVIIIIAFVFVPAIVPSARGGGDLVFGYYNKVPIKYVQNNFFARTYQMLSQNEQLSPDDPDFMQKYTELWRISFEEAAIRIGILDEMKQAGFVVPEDVVDRQMAELPQFQENGRFSSAKYRAMDNNSRLNLWQQVEESIIINTYLSDLGSLKTNSAETAFISSMASPKRSFDIVTFNTSSYPDSDVIAFAQANPNFFRVINLSRITITSSEREARQILDSIKNGTTTFEEAARNNSQDWAAERGGDIGAIMAYELEYDLSDENARESILNLAKGEYSDIFSASWGSVFYRVDEAARPADFEDTAHINKIKTRILTNMRGRVEDWLISEAERFSGDVRELGFDKALAAWEITKQSFGPLPVNYGNSAVFTSVQSSGILELENAGNNLSFWRTAFSTPLNTPSEPLVLENNVVVLYPLEELDAEEEETALIESFFPYWMNRSLETVYRSHFLTSKKMDDRFVETFRKLWGGNQS